MQKRRSLSARPLTLHIASLLALTCPSAYAAMGSIATSYGLLPGDTASAQALSLFNPQASAVYYNPAYLTSDPRGELSAGLSLANHQIEVNSLGGSNPMTREGDTLPIDDSQQTLLAMKTNMSSMTKVEHPMYFGIMIGIEKYGREMMGFQSETSTQGQYFHYSRQPLFITAGGATTLLPGIDGGLSFRVTLQADATLTGQSDLAGNTRYEQLQVSAKPEMTPIIGGTINWGQLLCPDSDCALKGWETAVAWRGASSAKTSVNANVVIPGTVPPPGLTLALNTLDAYQPATTTVGVQYKRDQLRVGVTGELQQWSKLDEELKDDTVRDQANLSFKDILIPRVGAEYRLNDRYAVTAGLAFEPSALKSDRSLDVNYLDNDRYVLGLGASAEFKNPWIFAFPVRMEFGYQLQQLKDRTFELTSSQVNNGAPYETVESGGQVHVFMGSLTLKF